MTIQIYRDRSGRWRWRAVAGNGRIIADSAEGYDTIANARRAVASILNDFAQDDVAVVELGVDPIPPTPPIPEH